MGSTISDAWDPWPSVGSLQQVDGGSVDPTLSVVLSRRSLRVALGERARCVEFAHGGSAILAEQSVAVSEHVIGFREDVAGHGHM
jgi:hypothetical protein